MLTCELDGSVVVTADGLASKGVLEQTQKAIVENHGSQCGFCTPGFVMSLFAYAQNLQSEDLEHRRETIWDALAGNLCRCTGYRPIVDAALWLTHRVDPRVEEWRTVLDALPDEVDGADTVSAPRSMAELDALLARHPSAKLLNGGTDIGVAVAKHGQLPARLISLRRVAGLDMIIETDEALIVGAAATYSEVLPYLEKHFPAFAKLVCRIGSVQIRNIGTMGGNVCNASPIGDTAPCLIALGAEFLVRSAAGRRVVPVDAFFTGYRKTALRPEEYLVSINIPLLKPGEKFFAYKIAKRYDQDISTVAAAFWLRVGGNKVAAIRVGFGGVAATPARALAVEKALLDEPLSESVFAAAADAVAQDFTPLTDFRAPAHYRLQAAAGLVLRAGAQLLQPEAVTDIWAL